MLSRLSKTEGALQEVVLRERQSQTSCEADLRHSFPIRHPPFAIRHSPLCERGGINARAGSC
jgi:hypothetical protein